MTKLESKKILVDKPVEEVYAFFQDFQNYKDLMPSSVDKYTATADTCEIGIKKMGALPMKITSREENKQVLAEKNGSALFNFTFEAKTEDKEGKTEIQLVLNADLNPMLKMVAQKPLAGFLTILVTRYQEKFA